MSYDLEKLAEFRQQLLLAEVGALLHNLGKLGQAFVFKEADDEERHNEFESYALRDIVGVVADYLPQASGRDVSLNATAEEATKKPTEDFLTSDQKDWLKSIHFKLPPPCDDREYCLGDFIDFLKSNWYDRDKTTGKAKIDKLFAQGSLATELLEASHGSASGGEKEGNAAKIKQMKRPIFSATVFGYETPVPFESLDEYRARFLLELKNYVAELQKPLASYLELAEKRREMLGKIKHLLIAMVADTQRPINDVSLWDISTSVAALHKAALAQTILQPTLRPSRETLHWRVLSISFDGPSFLEQSHHVTDLLGRQQALHSALDEVQDLLEVRYPIGNEIYRDEYGSLFAVPDTIHLDGKDLLRLSAERGESLERLIHRAFLQTRKTGKGQSKELRGDLEPAITLSASFTGKKINLSERLTNRTLPNHPFPERLAHWWNSRLFQGKDMCSVCGLRPQGYGARDKYYTEKAEGRKVCFICLDRRVRRSEKWMTDPIERKSTIWIDEVADQNGYAALVVGRFDLSHWLDGVEIERDGRPASFARLQRVWRTTQEFWQSLSRPNSEGDTRLGQELHEQTRLRIEINALPRLGDYHVYEAEQGRNRFSLVWHPDEQCFYTAENLSYLGRVLNFAKPAEFEQWLKGTVIELYEPSGYGRSVKKISRFHITEATLRDNYKPYIRLLDTPNTFMALVPAKEALDIASFIRTKYLTEMRCVLGRLPFALGLVYFGRRTPLRAVLDAGRRMLDMPLISDARFDFEFLDTTARRYEVHYAADHRRQALHKRHRPFALIELDQLAKIWKLLKEKKGKVTISQIRALQGLIETKRRVWNADDTDMTFVQFVHDVIRNADWQKGKPTDEEIEFLVHAAVSGMLSDVLEIHLSITKETELDQ